MKQKTLQNILITTFILNGLFSYSQQYKNPDYYLNYNKIEIKNLYLNPKNIDSMSVSKKTEKGEINIFTKTRKVQLLSLNDILQNFTSLDSLNHKVLFRINGSIINDLSNIRIDNSYFIYVETKKLTETLYLEEKLRELIIVEISLEKEERKPVIMIRGNNETFPTEINDLMK